MTQKMTAEAKAARAAYMREWRRQHPDKQREYMARFWERKGQHIREATERTVQNGIREENNK